MNRIKLVIALLCGFSLTTSAQDLKEYQKKYDGYLSVYLKKQQDMLIDIKGDSLNITDNTTEEIMHLSEKSNILSSKSIHYSHFYRLTSVDAKSMAPKGKGKFTTYKVKNFTDKSEDSDGIFYNDYKSRNFVFPNITEGSKSHLFYTQEILDPKLLPGFYFQSYLPSEEIKLSIKVHKNVVLNYKLFNTENFDIKFSKEEKGNYATYTWIAQNVSGYKTESDAPGAAYYLPHIQYWIDSYTTPKNGKVNVLSTLDDLYAWYVDLTKHIISEESDQLIEVAKGIISEKDSELEKVRKIFYWVQDNIKYVAFEDGMRGFVPHHANLTLSNRYGDCKDMASILYGLLKSVGIESYLTWIGTTDVPYKYHEMPTPAVDNHMILTYKHKDQYYFLDPTSSYHSFELPSSHIQGKQALLAINEKKYEVREVPVVSIKTNLYTDSLHFTIKDDKLTGKGITTINGYPKMYATYSLSGRTKEKEEKILRNMLEKGGNKFFLKDYKVSHLEDKDKALEIQYECVIEDYLKSYDDEIYLNMNFDRTFNNDDIPDTRNIPRKVKYALSSNAKVLVEIPKGYKIDNMPENVSFKHEKFGFEIIYSIEKNILVQKKTFYMDFMILDPEHFSEWNNMIKQINKAYRDVVTLKKIKK
ncbi:MAG: transglutaminase-like domain-containing protein [Cytophagaceae bacterium]